MELKLIRFMRHNPFMYDKKHTSYRNQILKDEKWTQLSRETKVPVDVLKKRWKSLRDRFYRLRKTDSGNSTYKYYSNLLFLSDVENRRKRTTTHEINEEAVDDILTISEDSFLLDQANFSSFSLNDNEISTSVSRSGNQEEGEDIEEVLLTEPNSQNSTPFRLFLESIALTVENANFSMNEVMCLQMRILELVQNEMNNRINDN